jgi:Nitroreductase
MRNIVHSVTDFFRKVLQSIIISPVPLITTTSFHSSTTTCEREQDDFDKVLLTRRTVNNFCQNLPENWKELVDRAIVSAIHAPNHKRTEPWRFYLLGPQTIRKVCELNAKLVAEKKGEKAGERKLERWIQMPGWIVVTCRSDFGEKDEVQSMDIPSGLAREDYAACCCAVQNLCLSLHNAGLGTKWSTGAVNFDSRFHDILGLETGEYSIGIIWFGTPTKIVDAPIRKKGLQDVLILHP